MFGLEDRRCIGLVGAGRTEYETLFGVVPALGGAIHPGRNVSVSTPRDAIKVGLA